MKKISITSMLICTFFFIGGVIASEGSPKVKICHLPPDNPDNYHSIFVSDNALQTHLDHGDWLGSCNDNCDVLCDDGDKCTKDHGGSCERDGCYPTPRPPVDCSDSDLCTEDSCDSVNGCTNTQINCSDGDPCTMDICVSETGSCDNQPIVCPEGELCDQSSGLCEMSGCPPEINQAFHAMIGNIEDMIYQDGLAGTSCKERICIKEVNSGGSRGVVLGTVWYPIDMYDSCEHIHPLDSVSCWHDDDVHYGCHNKCLTFFLEMKSCTGLLERNIFSSHTEMNCHDWPDFQCGAAVPFPCDEWCSSPQSNCNCGFCGVGVWAQFSGFVPNTLIYFGNDVWKIECYSDSQGLKLEQFVGFTSEDQLINCTDYAVKRVVRAFKAIGFSSCQ